MSGKKMKSPFSPLKKVFKTEDSKFIAWVGLKVSGISLVITIFIYWILFEFMRLNYAFFKAHGLSDVYSGTTFFDVILREAVDNLPVLFAFHIILFFIGAYVGWIILRPFRMIGEYCEEVLDNPNAIYRIEQFSNYSLLTRFSEFFFEFLRETRKKREIQSNSIPPQYSRIHKPVTDHVFMLHFGMLLVVICVCSGLFIVENTSAIYSSMIELATQALPNQKSVGSFFSQQSFVINDIVTLSIILITISYIFLGFHLYSKVSGAAFGIFSTMRAFMKGNHSSRVHLLGFAYVREYTRKLNKYLDYVEKNFSKEKS